MTDAPPMPEEIRNGFYPSFERGWRRAEVIGRIGMLLVVIGTLFGLLGGGPVSLWTRQVTVGSLTVDYPPVVRFGTPTGLTLNVRLQNKRDDVTIVMPAEVVKKFGLQSVYPHPLRWAADGEGDVSMTFAPSPGQAELRVEVGGLPARGGILRLFARLNNNDQASWSQVILP